MPPVGFERIVSTGERPQTYTIDPATTGTVMRVIGIINTPCRHNTERLNVKTVGTYTYRCALKG